MQQKYFKKIFFLLIFFTNIYSLLQFNGNKLGGFTFSLLNQISIDPLTQYVYVCSNENIFQNNNSLSYSVSVYDNKNNTSKAKRFFPIITRYAVVNGVLEINPLYEQGIAFFDLALGSLLEPKYYPVVVPLESSQIFMINNLDIYNNTKNFIISTDTLYDINGLPGQINNLTSSSNKFIASTLPQNTAFGNDVTAVFYPYIFQEKIVPIPGGSNYITGIAFNALPSFNINNTTESFLFGADASCNITRGSLLCQGAPSLNTFYIGISASGISGIESIINTNGKLINKDMEFIIDKNKIFATNQENIPLYNQSIKILYNSAGISYLIIHGGRNTIQSSQSTVYALPLINYSLNENEIGQLASINEEPTPIWNKSSPHNFMYSALSQLPQSSQDLYNWNDINAIVGCIPLVPYNKSFSFLNILENTINFPFIINTIEAYKDTVFASASYQLNDHAYIGGIFYSQALLNENGKIKKWSLWQRKDIIGDMATATYIPTTGSNIGMFDNADQSITGVQISPNGPFSGQWILEKTDCQSSGIQKIIDIPFTHPGVGQNAIIKNGLSPSYSISVGWNTIIIQQTANNSNASPLLSSSYIICDNGYLSNITKKNISTNMIICLGGELKEAGALFTAALGYTNEDAWFLAAGPNGIFILSNNDGTGCGPLLLQENFIGINETQSWNKLSNIKNVKKIISNNGFLYVITQKSIYRITLTPSIIAAQENAPYVEILSIFDIQGASAWSSFSDGLFSENKCLIASSLGLFASNSATSIKNCIKIPINEIKLPEAWDSAPIYLYPITQNGYQDSWAIGGSDELTGNIYVITTSISKHYSHIYRLAAYGNTQLTNKESIRLIPNYFLQNSPTYYYNPGIELLSIATDGASLFSHGVFGTAYLYRSFLGILNPLIKHGPIRLRNEYNFFELFSKSNIYFGMPTYISGLGYWEFASENGVYALC